MQGGTYISCWMEGLVISGPLAATPTSGSTLVSEAISV